MYKFSFYKVMQNRIIPTSPLQIPGTTYTLLWPILMILYMAMIAPKKQMYGPRL